MKANFKTWYYGLLVLLAALLCWSVWQSGAQTNAAGTAATNLPGTNVLSTNAPASVSALQSTGFAGVENEVGHFIPDKGNVTPDWLTDLLRRFPWLNQPFLGNALWKWLASLIYIFLAFYCAKVVDGMTGVWLKNWRNRSGAKIDPIVLDLLRGPVKVVTFILLLHIGLDLLSWPPKVQVWMTKGFTVVVAVAITYMTLKLVDSLVTAWRRRTQGSGSGAGDIALHEHLFPIVRNTLKGFVLVVAVLVTAQNLDINVTAALASLSVGGLAVGLAAQDTLANLFGAMVVFMDKPFRIGDHIVTDAGVDGVVETVGIRSTRVRNGKGYLVTIPNKTMGTATITNVSQRPNIQGEVNFHVACDTPVEKLRRALAILHEVFSGEPKVQGLQVTFDQFKDSALNLHAGFTWNGVDDGAYATGIHEFNMRVKERFEKEGIPFAIPARTVYVKQDSEWKVRGGDDAVGPGLG
jgi:MscS family membrane protein